MKKELKLFFLFIVLIVLIIISLYIFKISSLEYKIKKDNNVYIIKEQYYNKNIKIEITYSNKKYIFRLYNNKDKRVITNIHYFKNNNYECILPIINNKVQIDAICYDDGIVLDYRNIVGNNAKLDKFISSIKEYNIDKFEDNSVKKNLYKSINKYNNKINKKVSVTTYDGLIIDGDYIKLFNKDIYNNKLSTYVDKYYIIADYNSDFEFSYFYVIDLIEKEVFKIKSKIEISLDSYIQGIVDSKVYIYDNDNKNQYEIDINKKQINKISTNKTVKFYKNKRWENINKSLLKHELKFDYSYNSNIFSDYDYTIEANDYYYLFEKNNDKYNLYRVDKDNHDYIKYIAAINNTDIFYNENYIYFKEKDVLYYYSDSEGLKKILENTEFKYNDTIKYHIY